LIDKDTGEQLARSSKQALSLGLLPEGKEPPRAPGILPITPDGDASVIDGYRRYEPDKEAYRFIKMPNGKIRDFRLEFPEIHSLYKMCKSNLAIAYKGDFVHFMA